MWLVVLRGEFARGKKNTDQRSLASGKIEWFPLKQDTIGFGFTSDWIRNCREVFEQITQRYNSKPKLVLVLYFNKLNWWFSK